MPVKNEGEGRVTMIVKTNRNSSYDEFDSALTFCCPCIIFFAYGVLYLFMQLRYNIN